MVADKVPQGRGVWFAETVEVLSACARRLDLVVPGFQSPARVVGPRRTIRRTATGVVISVLSAGRSRVEVVDDLIDGVIAANGADGQPAEVMRSRLRAVMGVAGAKAA